MGLTDSLYAASGRSEMNGAEAVGLVLTIGLFAYLIVALLKPEWFA